MKEVTPYVRKAFYYETDRMDVIHHSNYVRWFEEARIDYMEKIGYSYQAVEALGIMSPVLFVECQYKVPVKFGDTVNIYVTEPFFNGIKLEFAYRIVNADTGVECVTGKTGHCFVNEDFKPISLKKNYPEIYQVYLEAAEEGK